MQTLTDATRRTQALETACAEDACYCHTPELSARAAIALESGGVDKLARTQSAPVLEELADALRKCVRNSCPAHGDALAEVSELQMIVNEADALDVAYWAERESMAVAS